MGYTQVYSAAMLFLRNFVTFVHDPVSQRLEQAKYSIATIIAVVIFLGFHQTTIQLEGGS